MWSMRVKCTTSSGVESKDWGHLRFSGTRVEVEGKESVSGEGSSVN